MPPPLPWFPPGVFRLQRDVPSLAPERSHARLEVEGELNGVGNGFTDFTPDLRAPLEITYGISSTGPLALVASTGRMDFSLANYEANSASLQGYYTPGHGNCRAGFRLGIRVRFRYLVNGTTYYKFLGWLDEVAPSSGKYREKIVTCSALDWMNEAASANPIISIQSSKRPDQVLATIQAAVSRQPYSTNYDTGVSTFPYSLDSLDNESGSVLSECQRIAVSEGNGHIFIRGNTTAGGELRFENRTARFAYTTVATFNETMHDLTITQARSQIRNKIKATTHPRRVGGSTEILFSDQGKPLISAGSTQILGGDYTDPANRADRIGGASMVSPVATTDYTMNTLANGTGTNLTANFVVTANYGGNSLEHTITNQSGAAGYITLRQARGTSIRDLDPIDTVVTDATSISLYGETRFFYDMPYQDDQGAASTMATYVLSVWGTPRTSEAVVTWRPRTDADKATAMSIEVGSAIHLTETMTALDNDFFVNQVRLHAEEGDILEFEWLCQLAVSVPFVQSRTTSSVVTNQTSHTVNMPSGIASGDLLVSIFTAEGIPTITWPAGWTRFAEQQHTAANGTISMAYRTADGTEGASITVTTGTATQTDHATYRIKGAADPATQPPQASIVASTVVTSDPAPAAYGFGAYFVPTDPPPFTPSGGLKNYLWLAAGVARVFDGLVSSNLYTISSGYGSTLLATGIGATFNWSFFSCEKNARLASEDPSPIVFVTGGGAGQTFYVFGVTIAVHPATS